MRLFATLLLALAAALLAAGCGEKSEPGSGAPLSGSRQSLRVMLDYLPNADHAGLYAAQAQGDYARAGLDVTLTPPPDPAAPLRLLQAGRADVAISYEPELLLARDKGATDLVAVAALVQKPLTSLMSIGKHPIRAAGQLAGKRVGTAGIPYQSAYLRTIEQRAHVNPGSVKETNVGFNLVPAMLSGRVDATLGAFWNYEGVQLAQQRKRPKIIRMEKAGVPTYNELVIVARQDELDTQGGAKVRRFLRALAQGMKALKQDPATGIDPLLRANRDLDRRLQEASVKATMPVFFPADTSKPFGYMAPGEWAAYGDWMARNRLLRNPPDAARALTDEFLPGQGI
jgi:putative hydroxymethylpyrimidine transport system substrate-binding protein